MFGFFVLFLFMSLSSQCSGVTPGGAQGPCGMPEIKSRLATCKAGTLLTVQSFWPFSLVSFAVSGAVPAAVLAA